ncbi:hypothetical protein GWN26_06440, partial [Candidatus Saccharibacteria bacterium]|nr:hypothetical protein [candidate division KSB1 bacterium]NIV04417.1 hypothetical protein [Calditrichia bacterium]NIV72857.1 hypothetical protein [Calditrichia bacterium]NIV98794.1 hypothetical protein [Candidatus Saccharibacteria bacterium]
NKMRASANPAKFAYDHAKKHLEFERVTAPDYIDSLKKQIREEVLQEMEADKKRKPAHNLVKSAPKGSNDTQPRAAVLDEIFADSHF